MKILTMTSNMDQTQIYINHNLSLIWNYFHFLRLPMVCLNWQWINRCLFGNMYKSTPTCYGHLFICAVLVYHFVSANGNNCGWLQNCWKIQRKNCISGIAVKFIMLCTGKFSFLFSGYAKSIWSRMPHQKSGSSCFNLLLLLSFLGHFWYCYVLYRPMQISPELP